MYIIRLDDASEYMDTKKWDTFETILDKWEIVPIVGVIPNNEDESMTKVYSQDVEFWSKVNRWKEKGWIIAMHGNNHKYESACSGMNPVHKRSEFAGLSLDVQKMKIKMGLETFKRNRINPEVFFAPSHTFDKNTLLALFQCSDIRTISDTIAYDIYYRDEFFFIPQQAGNVRSLPLKTVTFCYHPNNMSEEEFAALNSFFEREIGGFRTLNMKQLKKRKRTILDSALSAAYFSLRRMRSRFC